MTITGLYQVDCLSPFSLVLFLRFCLILLIGTYSSASPFCPILAFCFHVLGQSVPSPSLEGMALFRDVLWGSEVQSYLATRAMCSRAVPYMNFMHPPIGAGPWLLLQCTGGWDWPPLAVRMASDAGVSGVLSRACPLVLTGKRENSEMVLAGTSIREIAWDHKNCSLQCLSLPGSVPTSSCLSVG